MFQYIRQYDPYSNVKAQEYPHILITGALEDFRVPYWQPAKFAAKLRHYKKGDSMLLLHVDEGGHFGEGGDGVNAEKALEYSFLYKALNLHAPTEKLRE